MLNGEEISKRLENIPSGYFSPFSDFFKKSNETFMLKYKKLGSISNFEEDQSDVEIENAKTVFCNVPGCRQQFDTVNSYQSPYSNMHQFICSECKKFLPTDHLLDLHILEQHDSFFAARVARGDCIYSCLVAECDQKFYEPHERVQHCITDHKFPANFRFQEALKYSVQKSKLDTHVKKSKANLKEYDNSTTCKGMKLKNISFGHSKIKAFSFKHEKQEPKDVGKTLESMDTLTEALTDVMEE